MCPRKRGDGAVLSEGGRGVSLGTSTFWLWAFPHKKDLLPLGH